MMPLDWNLVSIVLFYLVIALFLYINRANVEVQGKILFLYRTKRFNKIINKIANSAPRFWQTIGLVAIPVGFVGMAGIFGYLLYTFAKLFVAPPEQAAISLVIPGVRIPGASIYIPFWYGIIALFVVILVHEGMHGVISEAFKNKIKNAGVGLLAFLPLAFVEPNERKLKKQPTKEQLAIFAAGPFANFATAAIVILLSSLIVAPLAYAAIVPAGITIDSVIAGQPAELAGLQKDFVISEVNGEKITNADDFLAQMQSIQPGQIIDVVVDEMHYFVRTIESPKNASMAYMGINLKQNIQVAPAVAAKYGNVLPWAPWHLLQLLFWIFALNLGIGSVNLLPLGPIDGGRMANLAITRSVKNKQKAQKLSLLLTLISLVLLVGNILGPYIARAI